MSKTLFLTTAALITAALLQPSLARDPSSAPGDPGVPRHSPSQVPAPAAIPLPSQGPILRAVVPAPPPQPIYDLVAPGTGVGGDQEVDAIIGVIVLPAASGLGFSAGDAGALEGSVGWCWQDGSGCGPGGVDQFIANCNSEQGVVSEETDGDTGQSLVKCHHTQH